MIPVLVINPHDGKEYNFAPFFQFLKAEGSSFKDLSQRCQKAGDAIPQFYDTSNTAYFKEMQDSLFLMNNLRDVFAAIEPVMH